MIKIDGIDYDREYTLEPVRVVCVLASGPINYDPPCLDGILAGAVVSEVSYGLGLSDREDAYDIPLPLECLWRNEKGWPLWAASYFCPIGESVADTVIQHRRAITGQFSKGRGGKLKITTNMGRHMERRMPYPILETRELEALAIGDIAEIARLLRGIQFLGKRRNTGLGEIIEWRIEPIAELTKVEILVRENKLSRAIPQGAVGQLAPFWPVEPPVLTGWTPPQWKPALFGMGWRYGTPVALSEPDYFEAVDAIG